MANVLFIGDIHGGHKNICNFRSQFNSEKEHLEFIKHNYHKKVTKRDKVFFMGILLFLLKLFKRCLHGKENKKF